jgi:hypothetical protein
MVATVRWLRVVAVPLIPSLDRVRPRYTLADYFGKQDYRD